MNSYDQGNTSIPKVLRGYFALRLAAGSTAADLGAAFALADPLAAALALRLTPGPRGFSVFSAAFFGTNGLKAARFWVGLKQSSRIL